MVVVSGTLFLGASQRFFENEQNDYILKTEREKEKWVLVPECDASVIRAQQNTNEGV